MSDTILFDFPPPTKSFVKSWRDIAERFCSALWHDPVAGHNTAVDAKLGPEHFPDPMLWTLACVLSGCAITEVEPKLGLVADAMHELGEPITAPDLAMIRWRHCCAAGASNYVALLLDYARRQTLHNIVGRWQSDALDAYEPIGDVAERVLDDVRDWQADGASLPDPPKLKRPPAIVVRPTTACAPRTSKQRNPHRRYGKVRTGR